MTIDKPAVALRSIVVVHPTCPARCILPAISRAGNQTTRTLTRGVTHGCFFGGNTALLSALGVALPQPLACRESLCDDWRLQFVAGKLASHAPTYAPAQTLVR